MREIKFDFIYKGANGFHHKQYYLENLIGKSLANLSDLHHQMELVASRQFTGLHDKNGKEVYEGDLVRASEDDDSYSHEVKFFRGGWVWTRYHHGKEIFPTPLHGFADLLVVCGNIYEHPELMEQGL